MLLRHLLGPHRLRPAPGRLLQLQPRSHGLDRKSARRAGRPPAPPPSPHERAPAPASRKTQALPSASRPVNHLRAPQPPRPPAPSMHDQAAKRRRRYPTGPAPADVGGTPRRSLRKRAPSSPCAKSACNPTGGRKQSDCPKTACHVFSAMAKAAALLPLPATRTSGRLSLLPHASPLAVIKSHERVLYAHHRAFGAVGWDLLTVETGSARTPKSAPWRMI